MGSETQLMARMLAREADPFEVARGKAIADALMAPLNVEFGHAERALAELKSGINAALARIDAAERGAL